VGLALYDLGLPAHITVIAPYTRPIPGNRGERWVKSITITVLCFYLEVEW